MMCQHHVILGLSYLAFLNRKRLNTINQTIVAVFQYEMTPLLFCRSMTPQIWLDIMKTFFDIIKVL